VNGATDQGPSDAALRRHGPAFPTAASRSCTAAWA